MKRGKESLWESWVTMGKNNNNYMCILGIPERKEKEKGTESLFKTIMAKNKPGRRNRHPDL